MKLFLDANVIISVLNREYPLFTYSARILSLSRNTRFKLYTSSLCLAIAFYFSSKKSGKEVAKRKIALLLENISLTSMNETTAKKAVANPQVIDFEDGLQYYSALQESCDVIITEDTEDFYFSDIEVSDCEAFILNLGNKPKTVRLS